MGRGMIDLTGQRFGRLRVMNFAGMGGPNRMWLCVCDCGAKTTVPTRNLRTGNTTSCGCLRLDRLERARKDTVASAETDTQGTPAKRGSVGERDQNSKTDHLRTAEAWVAN